MPLDLMTLAPEDAERLAYAEGFTQTAALFARLADALRERDAFEELADSLRDQICARARIADALRERGAFEEGADGLRDQICDLESRIADLEAERDA